MDDIEKWGFLGIQDWVPIQSQFTLYPIGLFRSRLECSTLRSASEWMFDTGVISAICFVPG